MASAGGTTPLLAAAGAQVQLGVEGVLADLGDDHLVERRHRVLVSSSTNRSWVSGRGGTMPSQRRVDGRASGEPIRIGSTRCGPRCSRSMTTGVLAGNSTRTPSSSMRITMRDAYPRAAADCSASRWCCSAARNDARRAARRRSAVRARAAVATACWLLCGLRWRSSGRTAARTAPLRARRPGARHADAGPRRHAAGSRRRHGRWPGRPPSTASMRAAALAGEQAVRLQLGELRVGQTGQLRTGRAAA